jgi:hypothetical protein
MSKAPERPLVRLSLKFFFNLTNLILEFNFEKGFRKARQKVNVNKNYKKRSSLDQSVNLDSAKLYLSHL